MRDTRMRKWLSATATIVTIAALLLGLAPGTARADGFGPVYPTSPAGLGMPQDGAGPDVPNGGSLTLTIPNPLTGGEDFAVLGATATLRARRSCDDWYTYARSRLAATDGTDLTGYLTWSSANYDTKSHLADYDSEGALLGYLQSQTGAADVLLNLEVWNCSAQFDWVSLALVAEPIAAGPEVAGVCTAADIHLVVDNSDSIGSANMTVYKQSIKDFMAAVEAGMPGTNWKITSFRTESTSVGSSVVTVTSAWAADPTALHGFVDGMVSQGYTPTADGINTARAGGTDPGAPLSNNANNVMVVLTDGAPNVVLGGTGGSAYMAGAAAAIEQAELARGEGWSTIVVTIGDGDGNVSDQWAANVNRGIAGVDVAGPSGDVLPVAQFEDLAPQLIELLAPGCERTIVVGKVCDPTGAPADDTTFSGKVDAGTEDELAWGPIGFGQFSAPIIVSAGQSHVVTEDRPSAPWSIAGYADGWFDQFGVPVCSADPDDYSGTSITVPEGDPLEYSQAVVCVMNYQEADPSIEVKKYVSVDDQATWEDADAPTGPYVSAGADVSFRFVVTNTGNVTLDNISLTDSVYDTSACSIPNSLAPGGWFECVIGPFGAEAGLHSNTATASGVYSGAAVSDTDLSHYFGTAPALSLVKAATPATYDAVGQVVGYSYELTNSGNVSLSGPFTVEDDKATDESCPAVSGVGNQNEYLDPGESLICTASYAITQADLDAGSVTNVAQGKGFFDGEPVLSNQDDETVWAEQHPAIEVEKELSQTGTGDWEDVDSPPGPGLPIGSSVYFRFVITNTGNVTLDNIALSDSVYDTSGCSLPGSLAPGGSFTCVIGPLSVEAGLHTNTATASGERGEDSYSDTDDANYTGVVVAIDIEKATNGEDADVAPGPMIAEGDPVSWTYVVTNTGQVRVSDIVVVDDQGVSVSCPKSELDAGESMVCTASGTAVVGQYENLGTVTGWYCGSWEVSDFDPSHYMGIANEPAIDIEKASNGEDADVAPGPVILVGDPVSWTYVVTNAGNVSLASVVVTDDNGTPGDTSDDYTCDIGDLPAGATDSSCSQSGTAEPGQYANVATVTGIFLAREQPVCDSDPSHYFGADPGIGVEKYVSVDGQSSWEDADEAPGPAVIVGSDVYFRFVVTNTGNVALESITLEDDTYDLSSCAGQIVDPLAPGAWFECIVGPLAAEEGQHLNLARARGQFGEVTYDDTDEAQYLGLAADVLVSKSAVVEWVRYYAWDIAKSVDRGEIALVLPSDSSSVGDVVTYTIVASRSVVADQYTVSGVVSLVNQGSGVAEVSSLVDQLQMSTDGGATWVAVAEEVMLAVTEAPIVLNPGDPAVEFSYSFDLAPVEGAIYRNVAKVEYGTVLEEVMGPALRAAGLATIVDPSVVVPVELPSVPDEEVNATALVSDVEAITSGGEGLTFAVRSVRVAGVEQADLVGPWAVSVGEDGTVVIVMVKEVEAERQGTWVLHNVARIEPEGPEAEADVVIQVEAGGPPTAVSLSRWDAVGGDGGVTHTWTTAFEKGIELFRVYRGAELATAQLVGEVTAQGRAADYRFVDGGLAAGTYYYWLVEVDGSGAEGQRFGPKSVVVGTSGQRLDGWKVYLPLTLKPER